MSDEADVPTVPVVCPECETTTRVDVTAVASAVTKHNENVHDGADVAHVDPDLAAQIADLAARDMGLTDD